MLTFGAIVAAAGWWLNVTLITASEGTKFAPGAGLNSRAWNVGSVTKLQS